MPTRVLLPAILVTFWAMSIQAQTTQPSPSASSSSSRQLDVAAIYFPSWHHDDHYSAWYGENWNEWRLVERNPPRFPGHEQLRPAPDWGYFDEADPRMMARQIDAAADHGVNVFIFDWYWYSGVRFIHGAVENGFRHAPNRARMKYALMWANHPWIDYYPVKYHKPQNWLLNIHHSPADFDRVMQHCIETHFNQPEYWRVKGGLYFSIFAPEDFMKQLGGPEKTKVVLDAARAKVAAAGLGKMHFAAFTGIPKTVPDCIAAGFDSLTSYNVTTMSSGLKMPDQPFEEYDAMIQRHEKYWDAMDQGTLPYAPVVTTGWDVTARWELDVPWPPQETAYPYTPIVVHNTPDKFGDLVRRALRHARSSKVPPPAIVINAWNEWTEGSAILPSKQYGDGYLRELKRALDEFATQPAK
jgi:hypothetical protein